MKVKEVNASIDELRQFEKDASNLQEYCLDKDVSYAILSSIQKDAPLSTDLRTFATCAIQLARHEIERLQHKIDNTEVNLN